MIGRGYYRIIDISESQWECLLQDKNVFREKDIELMLALYNSDLCKERATVLADILGLDDYRALIPRIVGLGKRIVKKLPNIKYPSPFDEFYSGKIPDTLKDYIEYKSIPFEGETEDDEPGHFYWILRRELEEAIKTLIEKGVINNSDAIIAYQIPQEQLKDLYEGAKKQIIVNAYERNRKARNICIQRYGYKCSVCGFNFEETYGKIGINFIEVHHKKPLHEIIENYQVDPINDLTPICPNCHSMLHKANLSVEELRNIYKEQQKINNK